MHWSNLISLIITLNFVVYFLEKAKWRRRTRFFYMFCIVGNFVSNDDVSHNSKY